MAFVLSDFARQTVGLNSGEVTADAVIYGAPAFYSYRSASDAIATIAGANYFAPVVYQVSENDLIFVVGTDAVGMYVISALDRAAGTISLTDASLTGAVDTANIVDLAVTTAKLADGAVTNAKVNAAAAIAYSKLAALPSAEILVGSAVNVATAVAMSGDVAIDNAGATTIQAGAVDKAMLAATVRPSHMIVFADQVTTTGGAAAEAFTVTGAVAATDRAFVQVVADGTGNVTVLQAVVTNDTLTVTFSADPQNDTIINYQLIRATS